MEGVGGGTRKAQIFNFIQNAKIVKEPFNSILNKKQAICNGLITSDLFSLRSMQNIDRKENKSKSNRHTAPDAVSVVARAQFQTEATV